MEDIKSNVAAKLRKIPEKPSTSAFNNVRIDEARACVYVRAQGSCFEGD
jgi:hypothetical protein